MDAILSTHLKSKLRAISKADQNLFNVGALRPEESLNVDAAHLDPRYLKAHHNAARWDYYLVLLKGTRRGTYYIEIHKAKTIDDVSKVIKKGEWLINRIEVDGALPSEDRPLFWVPAGAVKFPLTSIEIRQLAAKKIIILRKSETLSDHWE
jgi:hypothetical protein